MHPCTRRIVAVVALLLQALTPAFATPSPDRGIVPAGNADFCSASAAGHDGVPENPATPARGSHSQQHCGDCCTAAGAAPPMSPSQRVLALPNASAPVFDTGIPRIAVVPAAVLPPSRAPPLFA